MKGDNITFLKFHGLFEGTAWFVCTSISFIKESSK